MQPRSFCLGIGLRLRELRDRVGAFQVIDVAEADAYPMCG
jgi:hypothetical protein